MRSVEDRIELAKAFVYTAEQQDEIVALMRPLYYSAEMFRDVFKPMLDEPRNDVSPIPASPEEACINRVTKKARRCLAAFLEPRMTAKREKEKYERYIAALELAAQDSMPPAPPRRYDQPRIRPRPRSFPGRLVETPPGRRAVLRQQSFC